MSITTLPQQNLINKKSQPGFDGNLYEVKTASLNICKGINLDYKFEIGTNIKEGDKFDDIIFKYSDVNSNKSYYMIVQVKHSSNSNSLIDIDNLLVQHFGDYGLSKYYYSYQKIKSEKIFDPIRHAIIITNRKFNEKSMITKQNDSWNILRSIGNVIEEVPLDGDNCELGLTHDSNVGKIYRFKIDIILPALKEALVEYTMKMIATELVDSLMDTKTRTEYFIEKYHGMLVSEVIDLTSKKFRSDFIENIDNDGYGSNAVKMLRKELKLWVATKKKCDMKILKEQFKFKYDFSNDEKEQITDIINDDDVREFLKVFIIAIEPGVNELDELIETELKKEFFHDQASQMLHTIMENWIKGVNIALSNLPKDARFISSENIKELLTREDRKFNEKLFQGYLAELYSLDDLNFHFGNCTMIENLEKFLNSKMKVLKVSSKHTMITTVKIYKHLRSHCIITKLSVLFKRQSNKLIKSFDNKFCDHRLLIIECDIDITDNSVKDNLMNVLNNNSNKKVIFIEYKNKRFSSEFEREFSLQTQFQQFSDDVFSLDQLTEGSQADFLGKFKVNFQGILVELNQISNEIVGKSILGDIFTNFLIGNEIKIGESSKKIDRRQEYYISRRFLFESSFDDNTKVFLIGVDDKNFSNEWKYTHIESLPKGQISQDEKYFIDQRKNKMLDKEIYILRKEYEKMYYLRKAPNFTMEFKTIEEKINDALNRNIVLVSSYPGMGKSYVFDYMCHETKKKNPNLWVSKIDLNSFSKTLKTIIEDSYEDTDYKKLIHFMKIALNINSNAETELFENFAKNGKLILFFDGFDEIYPSYKCITINLIKTLNNVSKLNRIFISSRPNDDIIESIKDNCEVSIWELLQFSETDQIQYLRKFWQSSMGSKFDSGKFDSFTNEMMASLKDSFKYSTTADIFETPLQMMMIAMVYKSDFNAYVDNKIETSDVTLKEKLLKSHNLSSLYEDFIRILCYENCIEKNKMDPSNLFSQEIIEVILTYMVEKYQLLSLANLFNDVNSILDRKEQKILKSSLNEKDKIGIIIYNKNDNYHFVHKTYAEYFTARFIVDNLKRETIVIFFLSEVLKDEYKMVCFFIDDIWRDKETPETPEIKKPLIENKFGEKIHFAIKNNLVGIVRYLMKNDVDLTHVDKDNKTVLHLACQNTNQDILTMLLEKIEKNPNEYKDFLQKITNITKETPLLSISAFGTLANVKKTFDVCEKKISNNELKYVDRLNNNILHYAATNRDNGVLKFIIEYLEKRSGILESIIQAKGYKGMSPLLFAAQFGDINSVQLIFEKLIQFNVLESSIESLDYYNLTIIHNAVLNKNDEVLIFIVNYLEQQPSLFESLIKEKCTREKSLLLHTARYGTTKSFKSIFESLKKFNALENDIKSVDRDDFTVLHYAVMNEHTEVLRFLVEYLKQNPILFESLIHSECYIGAKPILSAVLIGNVENIKIILSAMEEIDALETALKSIDRDNHTFLHVAVANKNFEVLQFVIELFKRHPDLFKSIIKEKCRCGMTLISHMLEHCTTEKIEFLFNMLKNQNLFDIAILAHLDELENLIHSVKQDRDNVVLRYMVSQVVDYFKNNIHALNTLPPETKSLVFRYFFM